MNNSKLTPCRKVGLSRSKKTPKLKSLQNVLNSSDDNQNIQTSTPEIYNKETNKGIHSKKAKGEQKITPCRSVGLSRKRKKSNSDSLNKSLQCSGDAYNTTNISTNAPTIDRIVEDSHEIKNCSKKLLKQFSSESIKKDINEFEKISQDNIEDEVIKTKTNIKNSSKRLLNQFSSKSITKGLEKSETNGKDNFSDEMIKTEGVIKNSSKIILKQLSAESITKGLEESERMNKDNFENKVISVLEKVDTTTNEDDDTIKVNAHEHLDDYKLDGSQFTEVSYKTSIKISEAPKRRTTSKVNYRVFDEDEDFIQSPREKRGKKKIFEDDDDFENSPKVKKSKNTLKRFETDISLCENKKKNKLQKSFSVGDSAFESLESKDTLKKSCYIKLERLKDSKKPVIKVATTDTLSDDDFDLTPTPPTRDKLRVDVNKLEKEVEEKKKLLEDLERAKLNKKIHDVETLKELTLKWKHGCKAALEDLLKNLRNHAEIDLETLMKNLDIPQDILS